MTFLGALQDAATKFSGLLGNKNIERIAGIDIGSSAVKVVQAHKKGGAAVLETYGALALGPYGNVEVGRSVKLPIERTVEAVGDLLREANVTTNECAISIPLSSSLITYMEMPNLDTKRLASIIPIEARKYIPVPISEVTLDWILIPREESLPGAGAAAGRGPSVDHIDVLLVAIHNETLEQYSSIATALKLNVRFVEIEIFSTARAVLDKAVAPMMILDMGASSTKIYLVEHGIVRTSHIVNRGSQDVTTALARAAGLSTREAEETKRTSGLRQMINGEPMAELVPTQLDYIFAEANRVLLNYQRKHNKVVSKIVLTGGGVLLPGFLEAAAQRFETEVIRGNPFSKLESPAFLSDMLTEAGPEFSAAVGVTLRALQE